MMLLIWRVQMTDEISIRTYARKEEITIGTAYRRVWEGKVPARQDNGRWLIQVSLPEREEEAVAS